MSVRASLFSALSIYTKAAMQELAIQTGLSVERLKQIDGEHTIPTGKELESICTASGLSTEELMLRIGVIDRHMMSLLREKAHDVAKILGAAETKRLVSAEPMDPVFASALGQLYQGDCLRLLSQMSDASVDLVFADPPFNLDKAYPSGINDDLRESDYLDWCESWLSECVRVLKPGGSLFLWNLPRWCAELSGFLSGRLNFRHWIAVDIKYRLPITGRLYPSHYALLYFTKGKKPSTFVPDRLPMQTCPHCFEELRDYGGYKHKMNAGGVNLSDVWYDIPPVRHAKYKNREGANELSVKLMDRVIELATEAGDTVFDPFGGAGTTYAVAEMKGRRWIGVEIGPIAGIVERLRDLSGEREYLAKIRADINHLFPPEVLIERERRGHWTPESVRNKNWKARPGSQIPLL